MTGDGDSRGIAGLAARLRLVQGAVLALLLLLVAALAHRQIARVDEHTAQERRQSQRRILQPAPRGQLFDRENRLLAGTRFRTAAMLDLARIRSAIAEERRIRKSTTPDSDAGRLAAGARFAVVRREFEKLLPLLDSPRELPPGYVERHFTREPALPLVLIDSLTPGEIERLSAALPAGAPVRLVSIPERFYPHGSLAAHVIGRVRKNRIQSESSHPVRAVAAEELAGDFGLEKFFDARLRGTPSATLIRVDAAGRPAGEALSETPATAGEDLVLSLDLALQQTAERAMDAVTGSTRGSAVVIDVRTGEILALVSRPGFDLNRISPAISAFEKGRLDSTGAWLNRATQALYPPGSSHKIFTALAGLRHGSLDARTTHHCAGFLQIGNHRFPCHRAGGHGENSLRMALAQSCNIFACQTGMEVGPDALVAEARRFNFDVPTGIELPGETSRMLVPDPARKPSQDESVWTSGDTANLAIGQGFLRYSPLQAACAMASLARRETLTLPTLIRQPGRSPAGDRPRRPLDLCESSYSTLLDALEAVVQVGIGQNAQVPGVRIAGKTGTAQIVRAEGMMNVAWFVAFAPVENPEIALAVALEGDLPDIEYAGAAHAAPVAGEIMSAYFSTPTRAHPAATEVSEVR